MIKRFCIDRFGDLHGRSEGKSQKRFGFIVRMHFSAPSAFHAEAFLDCGFGAIGLLASRAYSKLSFDVGRNEFLEPLGSSRLCRVSLKQFLVSLGCEMNDTPQILGL